MKKILSTLLVCIVATGFAFAQAPGVFKYQAVVRDNSGNIIASQSVKFRISLLKGSPTGTTSFLEEHTTATNQFGIANLEIGNGSGQVGSIDTILWEEDDYFIKIELDPTGSSGYQLMGTSQLLSVPYALYAESSGSADDMIHYVGENYGGGIVFYIYDGGLHGLIASIADQNTSISWCGGSTNPITLAKANGVGAGLKNTAIIVSSQGNIATTAFAASVCNEYSVTDAGVTYGDWYLPSKYELNLLYLQMNLIGGFGTGTYWSSNEYEVSNSYRQDFTTGGQGYANKQSNSAIRAIRAF